MAFNKIKLFLLCLLLVGTAVTQTKAQNFAEWFSQGKTQIKYLEQQIVALNALRVSTEQCYGMLKNEWGAIGNFKNGEFGLHQTYYTSLSQVNPVVKNNTDITSVQAEVQSIASQFNTPNGLSGLTISEQSYVISVQQNLAAECNNDLAELQKVLSPGTLVMSDDERIKRINQLTADIKDKYVFTCSFCNQVKLLALQHKQDTNEVQTLNQWYGNP